MDKTAVPENRYMFGQYLLEKKKINDALLRKALEIQQKEKSQTLRTSHRLLGQILLEEFQVFRNRVELNKYLVQFKTFNEELENQRQELRSLTSRKNP